MCRSKGFHSLLFAFSGVIEFRNLDSDIVETQMSGLVLKRINLLAIFLDNYASSITAVDLFLADLGLYLMPRVVFVEGGCGNLGGRVILFISFPNLIMAVNRVLRESKVLL